MSKAAKLFFGQHTILKAKEKKGREDSGRRTGRPTKATPIMSLKKGGKTGRPAHFQGQPTALISFLLLAACPTATCDKAFFFPFSFKINFITMRPKNNKILRFDSRELAKSCFCYFPVKAVYGDGFTIIISGASDAEWTIYQQVIGLLRDKK